MPTRNIDLTNHYDRFVEDQVASGKFKDASDVLNAGLRLLEQQTNKDSLRLAALRALTEQAFDELDRGEGIEIDPSTGLEKRIAAIGRRAADRVAQSTGGE